VKEIPNGEERIRAIAKSYVEWHENALTVSPDDASRCELNVAVRQESKATGAVAREDHNFRVLVQRQEMTGAERSWATTTRSMTWSAIHAAVKPSEAGLEQMRR
jgi:hypothetical protein